MEARPFYSIARAKQKQGRYPESIAAINAVTTLPVLRPLIGADKSEIVARAQAIGTYEISIRPYEDCCSLFVPAHPRTQPSLEEAQEAEAHLAIDALVDEAIARSERITVSRTAAAPAARGAAGRPVAGGTP